MVQVLNSFKIMLAIFILGLLLIFKVFLIYFKLLLPILYFNNMCLCLLLIL